MGILDAPALVTPHVVRRQNSYLRGLVPCAARLMASASTLSTTNLSSGSAQSSMGRTLLKATADCQDLRLVFGNYSYGTAGPNVIFVRASIEIDQGNAGTSADNVAYPAQFGGQFELTLSADGCAMSDPIPLRLTKGQTFYVRTYVRVGTLGEKWPGTTVYRNSVSTDQVVSGGTDQTQAVGFLSGTATGGAYVHEYGPLAVLGSAPLTTPVFGLFGDSITVGLNDSIDAVQRGWAERGLADNYAFVNVSRHTEGANQLRPSAYTTFTAPAWRHKFRFLDGCTHVICSYGVNDAGGVDATATIQSNLLALWTELTTRGLKVWAYTLPPKTTSTDSWATVGNQTTVSAANAKRVPINNWIRDGAPIDASTLAAVAVGTSSNVLRAGASGHPIKGYVETADAVESARDSGLWKASYSDDGLHPLTVGHTAMGAVLAAALPTILAS